MSRTRSTPSKAEQTAEIADLGWELSRTHPRYVARMETTRGDNTSIRFESAPDYFSLLRRVQARNVTLAKENERKEPARPFTTKAPPKENNT